MVGMRTVLAAALGCAFCPVAVPAAGQHDAANLSASEIIKRSVAVNTADWKAQPLYEHQELDLKSKVDTSGTAHGQQSKTYEVMMIDGSPYSRLIAIDNEPL